MKTFRLTGLISKARGQFLIPLYANAYTLIFNQILSAGLGMVYWTLAARLFPPEVVGQNTAIISLVMLVSAIAEFSLKSAMTRFVPRAGKMIKQLIFYTYAVNIISSLLVSVAFLVFGYYFRFSELLLSNTKFIIFAMIVFPIAWTIFYVQDGILIGFRKPVWVLVENSVYNLVKIIFLLSVFFVKNRNIIIIISWFLPVPFIILLVNVLIFFRFIPQQLNKNDEQLTAITSKQVIKSVGGDHIGTIFAEACVRLLPLLVLNLLGKDQSAYFFQAWLVGSTIYLIAYNLASSFSVEASMHLSQITIISRQVLAQKARLVLPLAVGVFFFAPLILRIFGEEYSEYGTVLLRWLAFAAFPLTLNVWYLGYARVTGKIGGVIRNQASIALITLCCSYLWLPQYGLAAVGISWFIAQALVSIIVLVETAEILLGKVERLNL